jgi:hypothetical protein
MTTEDLLKIKPAYSQFVKYTTAADPVLPGPGTQHSNESDYPDDEPVNDIDMAQNAKWGLELREAAEKSLLNSDSL